MPRVGRSGDSRVVTCLEAAEMGFTFISTCSKCDYYLQNKALNAKAMTLPRRELSKLWQCSSNHTVGDLNSRQFMNTPFQRENLNKYNSYICSDRSSRSIVKRVRLFESTPSTANNNIENIRSNNNNDKQSIEQPRTPSHHVELALIERDTARQERESAIGDRDAAIKERDAALAAKDAAQRERDAALADRDKAQRERDAALADRDKVQRERDAAYAEMHSSVAERASTHDALLNQLDVASADISGYCDIISSLKAELKRCQSSCDKLQLENKRLLDALKIKNDMLAIYEQRQAQMHERVCALEHRQAVRASKTYVMVSPTGPPLKYIQNFANALFPEKTKQEKLKALFDILYEKLKSFCAHVKRQIKPAMLPILQTEIMKEIRNYYAPWRFLEVLDGSKQSLNQECYKAIYSVQKNFPKWAKVLPEIKSVQKAQYKLDSHLEETLPLHLEVGRETGYFHYRSYLEYILNSYGLLDVIDDPTNTEPVRVAVTFDGGSVSRFLSHVTGGFKLVDSRAINPRTHDPLFGESGHDKLQSHVHCFPIKMAMAKDSKELYRTEFRDFFQFLKDYEREKGYKIKFLFPQDMSSIWKTTGRGGTAKVKSFPCYCCAVTTSTLVAAQPKEKCFRGQRCLQPLCFHHSMICAETIQNWELEKQQIEQEYPYLLFPTPNINKSQVFLSSINELRDEQNPYDIEYQPSTLEEGIEFNAFLNTELGYRELPAIGTVREKRQRLRSALEAEQIYKLMTKLVGSIDHDSAFCAVEDDIPCIMHGGVRMNEKLFMLVLLEAWESCETNAEREALIQTVENYINSGVFGTEESRAQWKLPVSKESELETVSFTAWRGRKVVDRLADIAQLIMLDQDQSRLRQWQSMISKYLNVMKFAFRHEDFSDDDVEDFQDLIDDWFYQYINLVGLPGITNYMHLLGAGHLYFYLKKWGNLYRYQQQGWEMKNGVIASFIMRRTRRGGSGGKYGPAHTSRIEPLLKWFRRSTAWATGDAEMYFLQG